MITPKNILALRSDARNRNVGKLNGWASIQAVEKVKHGLDDPEAVTIQFRPLKEDQQPWVLNLRMRN